MATLEISYATSGGSKEEIFKSFSFAVLLVNFGLIMRLNDETFLKIIEATPLVSIDLIIRNAQGAVLLGKRLNRPAQGFWFVPGGRIRKNERVHQALERISREECGFVVDNPTLIGVFDHIYDDNFAGREGINTQYVVIAYSGQTPAEVRFAPDSQHSELKWWAVDALMGSREVHANTKAYFRENQGSTESRPTGPG